MGKRKNMQQIPAMEGDSLGIVDCDIEPITLPNGKAGVGLMLTSEIVSGNKLTGQHVQQFYVLDPMSCPMLADLLLRAGECAVTGNWPKENAPLPYGAARPKNGNVTLNS